MTEMRQQIHQEELRGGAGEEETSSDDGGGPRCVLTVTHGGTPHRVELSGTVESLRFFDVLGALRHVRQRMPPNSVAKLVYMGKIRSPDTTLAQAGILEGSQPRMVLVAAQQTPGPATGSGTPTRAPESDSSSSAASASSTGATIAPPDAIALYDFQPQRERQLKLSAGDLLSVLSSSADDWWLVRPYGVSGESEQRAAGWVPAAYITTRPGWEPSPTAAVSQLLANQAGVPQRDAAIKQLTERYQRERRELTLELPRREAVYAHVAQYAHPDVGVAWRWVISTLLLAGSSSVLLVWLSGYWLAVRQAEAEGATPVGVGSGVLTLLVTGALLLAACSRVKLFIMFHDCTHNAMFGGASDGDASDNELVGVVCGALCHTSYSSWKAGHLYHHRHSNNLTHSQVSQSAFWTTRYYASATPRERLLYHIQVGSQELLCRCEQHWCAVLRLS